MSNLLALALCQAVFMSTSSLMVTVGSLAGHALAGNRALATLPATANVVGTALAAIPASYLCRRLGRRQGFLVLVALAAGLWRPMGGPFRPRRHMPR